MSGFIDASGSFAVAPAVWSAGGTMIQARRGLAGAGTQNAALATGGTNTYTCTEEYNGTAWSEVTNKSDVLSRGAGTGTQNAALVGGGSPGVISTEKYNGSTWSDTAPFLAGSAYTILVGTQNAAYTFASGKAASPYHVGKTEEFDGTQWAYRAEMNHGAWMYRYHGAGVGSVNAALAACSGNAPQEVTE